MQLKIDDRRNREKSPITFEDLKIGEVYVYGSDLDAAAAGGNGPRLKISADSAVVLEDFSYPIIRYPPYNKKVIRLKATLVIEADDTP